MSALFTRVNKLISIFIFLLFGISSLYGVQAQTAEVQIIHNSADPAFEVVDIYADGEILLDSVVFRSATQFIELEAGVDIKLDVVPYGSGIESSVYNKTVNLEIDELYYIIAVGVGEPTDFAENPSGRSSAFMLDVYSGGQKTFNSNFVGISVYHGASDVQALDVNAPGGTLVGNIPYTDYTNGFISLPPDSYLFDLKDANNENILSSFEVDISGLNGSTAMLLISGFLEPSNNNEGPALSLMLVLPDGTVTEITEYIPSANVQIIHNAADPSLEMVDIYANGELIINDVAFREASSFLTLEAGVDLELDVTPHDEGVESSVYNTTVNLEVDETYYMIASGVGDVSSFADNPSGSDIGLSLELLNWAEITASSGNTGVALYHGSTDAPSIDVKISSEFFATNLAYRETTGAYIELPANNFTFDVYNAGTSSKVGAFGTDLSGFVDSNVLILASGFLEPSANNSGANFGLLQVSQTGSAEMLTAVATGNERENNIPEIIKLNQNYPNPFNPSTQISYTLSKAASVRIDIFDANGQKISTLMNNRTQVSGEYSIDFDGSNLSSGIYFYRIKAGDFIETRKMMLIK